jgi:phosphoserine phosphatase
MYNKLVIFDFDDTLFPTSQIEKTKTFTADIAEKFNYVITNLFNILWQRNFKIIIVSNAEIGWINHWKKYIPILNYVDIYSARDKYQNNTKIKGEDWKKLMYINLFANELINYNYVVGVGDSPGDYTAAIKLYHTFDQIIDKFNVKFIGFQPQLDYDKLITALVLLPEHEYFNFNGQPSI